MSAAKKVTPAIVEEEAEPQAEPQADPVRIPLDQILTITFTEGDAKFMLDTYKQRGVYILKQIHG